MISNRIKIVLFILFITGGCSTPENSVIKEGIQVSTSHPQYWAYGGKEILLLGGSVEDNLFQMDSLEYHLDVLKGCGGNYVRNTMSSRDPGNVWPFKQNKNGRYNLDQWNPEYWSRLENFLKATSARNIIVQLEIWATFDFYRDNWLINPFNPANNINYDARRVKLDTVVNSHPIFAENNFFRSVPEQMSILKLLEYQQKFVDKLLSYTLEYDHVLYCMDNETSVSSDWGKFWSDYVRKKAFEHGPSVHTTEMWDPWDLNHVIHRETFDHPEVYSFVDISQNNHNSGEKHWSNGIQLIEHLKKTGALRPCNNVKVYGNDGGPHQTTQNGIECFVRNVFFGAASTRFHRPPTGQGLNDTARLVIRNIRRVIERVDFFDGMPLEGVILEKEPNEAYCRGKVNEEYLFYFPDGGEILAGVKLKTKTGHIIWINLLEEKWHPEQKIPVGDTLKLVTPGKGNWIAILQS